MPGSHIVPPNASRGLARADRGIALVRGRAGWFAVLAGLALAGCGGPQEAAKPAAAPVVIVRPVITHPATPQIPPVEFGRRPPNTPMTSANMPFFDTVTYCEWSTGKKERLRRGPLYETCIAEQANDRDLIGSAIDARRFKEPDIVRCAKASRTAYHGMWYCLNDQPYS